MHSITSEKNCWSILKTLLSNKKILYISPLFCQDKYVTDFKKKTELLNFFFAKQCSMGHVVEGATFEPPKKVRSVILVRFCFEIQVL